MNDPPKQYEAMLEGKIEMAIYPMGYASAKFPELSIVTLPGVPASAELAGILKGTEFEEQLQRLCEEKGFRILTWWWLDGGMASRSRAVTGPASIKDLGARSGGGNDFNAMLAGRRRAHRRHAAERGATGHRDRQAGRGAELVRDVRELSVLRDRQVRHGRRLQHADGVHAGADLQDRLGQPQGDGAAGARGGRAASDIYLEASQREAQEDAVETFTKAGVKVQPLSFEEYAAWLEIARDTAWKNYRAVSPRASDLLELAAARVRREQQALMRM